MNLFVFGLGYSASHYVLTRRNKYASVCATVRSAEKRDALMQQGIRAYLFSGAKIEDGLAAELERANHVLVSIPPGPAGDPAIAQFAAALDAAPALRSIVYLSTIGVYGDHDGAWIDETTPPVPSNDRSSGAFRQRTDGARPQGARA